MTNQLSYITEETKDGDQERRAYILYDQGLAQRSCSRTEGIAPRSIVKPRA
jgi:hypothetical protein